MAEGKAEVEREPFVDSSQASDKLSIITGDGQFDPQPGVISAFLRKHEIYKRGTKYCIVGIMGCQSSGKSTLLNLLFGTKFEELDAKQGRKMTTKGIWFGAAPKLPDVLVLDLEGTDSANRPDDRGAYERQTALFALALTEVLIVNMWQSDIGRYVAANYGVLSTIFEVNLQLFAHDAKGSKTILLFMIRDHDQEETPLQTFKDQITRDVEKIWNELSKPEEFKSMSYTDLFELRFYSLPHKKHQAEKFMEGIENLRRNFSGEGTENYFETGYHQRKSVPAESLGVYASRIWESITTHKDLNIPSEKKMLAMFRCDEILHSVVLDASPKISALREKVQGAYLNDFRVVADEIITEALASFDDQAHGYDADMVAKKKEECADRIREELRVLYLEQLGHARSQAVSLLRSNFAKTFPRDRISTDYYEDCRPHEEATRKFFAECAEQSRLPESNWSWESSKKDLEKGISELEITFRSSQLEALNEFAKHIVREKMGALDPIFAASEPKLWSHVTQVYAKSVVESIAKVVDGKLTSFKPSLTEVVSMKKFIFDSATSLLLEDSKREALYVKRKMHNSFDKSFKLGADGVSPRQWSPRDDIRKIFEDSVEKANKVAELYRYFQVESSVIKKITIDFMSTTDVKEDEKTEAVELLTEAQLNDYKLQFRNEVDGSLIQAELSAERQRQGSIPPLFLLLLIVLGWNEIWMILSNPIYLILTVLVGGGYFVIQSLGMENAVFGVVKQLALQTKDHIMREIAKYAQAGAPAVGQAGATHIKRE